MSRKIGLFFIVVFTFINCDKNIEIEKELNEVVEKNISLFDNILPAKLSEVFKDNSIVIFGETHYVQEHQEFIVDLLPQLSLNGYTILYEELFHCFSWMVEDYLKGDLEELPEFILYFNSTLIEGMKNFNSSVGESQRITLKYMDSNNWRSNFKRAIEEVEKVINTQSFFNDIKNSEIDTPEYLNALENTFTTLTVNASTHQSVLGITWYNRILEMIDIEIRSSKFRLNDNRNDREKIMFDLIMKGVNENNGHKIAVNTGMFHGQKVSYMGNDMLRIGQMLDNTTNEIYSIALVGIKGKTKTSYDATNKISFNLINDTSEDNVIKIIHDIAGNSMSFLELDNEIFLTSDIKISYSFGTTIEAPIGNQFDAIVSYPDIEVLHSMDIYDWRK